MGTLNQLLKVKAIEEFFLIDVLLPHRWSSSVFVYNWLTDSLQQQGIFQNIRAIMVTCGIIEMVLPNIYVSVISDEKKTNII